MKVRLVDEMDFAFNFQGRFNTDRPTWRLFYVQKCWSQSGLIKIGQRKMKGDVLYLAATASSSIDV